MSVNDELSYLFLASNDEWNYKTQQGHCILIETDFLCGGDDPNPTHHDSIGSHWLNCA